MMHQALSVSHPNMPENVIPIIPVKEMVDKLHRLNPNGVAPPAKEPWQMSWSEWYDYYHEKSGGNRFVFATRVGKPQGILVSQGEPLYTKAGKRYGESGQNDIERWRRAIIRHAIASDEAIPPEVLKDYPDLVESVEGKLIVPEAKPGGLFLSLLGTPKKHGPPNGCYVRWHEGIGYGRG